MTTHFAIDRTNAVAIGSYSEFKTVKTRSVVQMIVEFPIERAKEIVDTFGVPLPGHDTPVAIALPRPGGLPATEMPVEASPPRGRAAANPGEREECQKAFGQCHALLADDKFVAWLLKDVPCPPGVNRGVLAADVLRSRLRIESRSELRVDVEAARRMRTIARQYEEVQRYGSNL